MTGLSSNIKGNFLSSRFWNIQIRSSRLARPWSHCGWPSRFLQGLLVSFTYRCGDEWDLVKGKGGGGKGWEKALVIASGWGCHGCQHPQEFYCRGCVLGTAFLLGLWVLWPVSETPLPTVVFLRSLRKGCPALGLSILDYWQQWSGVCVIILVHSF